MGIYEGKCRGCLNYTELVNRTVCQKCHRLQQRYGVYAQEILTLARKQDGRCAICQRNMTDFKVDVDKETGNILGLLCASCCRGIKYFRDPTVLQHAQEYASRPPAIIYKERGGKRYLKKDPTNAVLAATLAETAGPLRRRARVYAQKVGLKEDAALSRIRRFLASQKTLKTTSDTPTNGGELTQPAP